MNSTLVNDYRDSGVIKSRKQSALSLTAPLLNGEVITQDAILENNHFNSDANNLRGGSIPVTKTDRDIKLVGVEIHQNGDPDHHKPKTKTPKTCVTIGMRLKKWIITDRIGAGSFGETFAAVCVDEIDETSQDGSFSHRQRSPLTSKTEVCIKVEQEDRNLLRLEAGILKKLQSSPHVVRYIGSGSTGGVNFLVMQKLGPNLAELRRNTQTGTFSPYTTLKVGISCLLAIQDVHKHGFVHRDIKPSNIVIASGNVFDNQICYVIDFGLARRYRRANNQIRPPRENAGFRGTSRYASLTSHLHGELGRVDDLWSLLFMLVEFITGTLPWRKCKEKEEIGRCKEQMIGPTLVQNLPREFRPFLMHLLTLRYEDEPNYEFLISLLERAIERRGYPQNKALDWETEENDFECVDPVPITEKNVKQSHPEDSKRSLPRHHVSAYRDPLQSSPPQLGSDVRPKRPAPALEDVKPAQLPRNPSTPVIRQPSPQTEDSKENCGINSVSDAKNVYRNSAVLQPNDASVRVQGEEPSSHTEFPVSVCQQFPSIGLNNPGVPPCAEECQKLQPREIPVLESPLQRIDTEKFPDGSITVDVDEGFSPREGLDTPRVLYPTSFSIKEQEFPPNAPAPGPFMNLAPLQDEKQDNEEMQKQERDRTSAVSIPLKKKGVTSTSCITGVETAKSCSSSQPRENKKKKKFNIKCNCATM